MKIEKNLFKAFPHLFTLSGERKSRDPLITVSSLEKLRDLEPEYLIPTYTNPLVNKDDIKRVLSATIDGIRLVNDQTIRFMNKGLL